MKDLLKLSFLLFCAYFYFQEGFIETKPENKIVYCEYSSQTNCSENYRAPAIVMDMDVE